MSTRSVDITLRRLHIPFKRRAKTRGERRSLCHTLYASAMRSAISARGKLLNNVLSSPSLWLRPRRAKIGFAVILASVFGLFYLPHYGFKLYKHVSIKYWFDTDAATFNRSNVGELHKGSGWSYLDRHGFESMILVPTQCLNPPILEGNSVFEFGVGTGGAIHVLASKYKLGKVGGTDFSSNSIEVAKTIFPEFKDNFWVQSMTEPHLRIPENSYDHVFSFGAMGMYLSLDEMPFIVKEAVRITKRGGSLLFTHFIEPGGSHVGSIVDRVPKSFWAAHEKMFGVTATTIQKMDDRQKDRYAVCMTKV